MFKNPYVNKKSILENICTFYESLTNLIIKEIDIMPEVESMRPIFKFSVVHYYLHFQFRKLEIKIKLIKFIKF